MRLGWHLSAPPFRRATITVALPAYARAVKRADMGVLSGPLVTTATVCAWPFPPSAHVARVRIRKGTCPTDPTSPVSVSVSPIKRVTPLTVSLVAVLVVAAPFLGHVSRIVAVGAEKEMVGIHAKRHVAAMQDAGSMVPRTFGDRTIGELPREPMRPDDARANRKETVCVWPSAGPASKPEPTARAEFRMDGAVPVNLRPESLCGWLRNGALSHTHKITECIASTHKKTAGNSCP